MVLEHIQKLLFDHDCVIIPDFGGLITHYEAAKIHPVRHTFMPPAKRVAFNEKLQLNDGLLISTLAYDKKLTAEAAQLHVAQFVRDLQSDLNQNRRCDLKGVGIFRLNYENKIEFEYIENENYLNDAFGLPELISKPIVAAEPVMLRTLRPEPQMAGKRGFKNYIRRYYRAATAMVIGGIAVTGLYYLSLQTDYNVSAINPVTLFQSISEDNAEPAPAAAPVKVASEPINENKVTAEITLPETVTQAGWPTDTVVEAPIRIAIKPASNKAASITTDEINPSVEAPETEKENKGAEAKSKPARTAPKVTAKAKPVSYTSEPTPDLKGVKRNFTIDEINAALGGKTPVKSETTATAKFETTYKPLPAKPVSPTANFAAAPAKPASESALVAKPTTIKSEAERFYVIVNGYATYENAERNRQIIAKKGRPGQIIQPFGDAKLYRIAIAEYDTKEQAIQQLPQLKNKYGSTIWILKH
jgi:hypothetical protein